MCDADPNFVDFTSLIGDQGTSMERYSTRRDQNMPLKYTSETAPTTMLGEFRELVVSPEYVYKGRETRRYEIELLDFYACKEALQLIPCNEMCLYRKGETHLLLRDHKEASFSFQDALSVNAKHLKTFPKLNLWQDAILDALLRERKMFQEALKHL
ncbi:hypothetical protein EGR_07026 [Echinococcus granulosus]|uniref:Tetratricopeptide repeat protein n=1 Tax=Echinococcus granulosus TaxID=6210 RepID=W6UC19_ECHGR|nr:hypothetical protein EGR_07026 [Echinococcus granulosus]EUB58106.1 hypothetical protein EGR_07026 [Echinococcus granulosus]